MANLGFNLAFNNMDTETKLINELEHPAELLTAQWLGEDTLQ
jgi:hypothetical protein